MTIEEEAPRSGWQPSDRPSGRDTVESGIRGMEACDDTVEAAPPTLRRPPAVSLLHFAESPEDEPRASRRTVLPPELPQNPVKALWMMGLAATLRRIEAGEASTDRSAASIDAQVATATVVSTLLGVLKSFGDAIMRGEALRLSARASRRDGRCVVIEIDMVPEEPEVRDAG